MSSYMIQFFELFWVTIGQAPVIRVPSEVHFIDYNFHLGKLYCCRCYTAPAVMPCIFSQVAAVVIADKFLRIVLK